MLLDQKNKPQDRCSPCCWTSQDFVEELNLAAAGQKNQPAAAADSCRQCSSLQDRGTRASCAVVRDVVLLFSVRLKWEHSIVAAAAGDDVVDEVMEEAWRRHCVAAGWHLCWLESTLVDPAADEAELVVGLRHFLTNSLNVRGIFAATFSSCDRV